MKLDDCFFLGRVTKAIGLRGDVVVPLESDDPAYYNELESVFVSHGGNQLIPFFVQSIQVNDKGGARISFEGVNSVDEARDLVGAELYLPLDFLPPLTGTSFYFHEVIGFEVVDTVHGVLGTIESVTDNTAQALLSIMQGHREVLIPATDEFILSVDRENKRMEVETPEGLIELFLS